jgi:hypothetical protein
MSGQAAPWELRSIVLQNAALMSTDVEDCDRNGFVAREGQ